MLLAAEYKQPCFCGKNLEPDIDFWGWKIIVCKHCGAAYKITLDISEHLGKYDEYVKENRKQNEATEIRH